MKTILPILLCLLLSSCSTITKGSTQTVSVSTPGVEDALCTLSSPAIGSVTVRTPGNVMLTKSKYDIQVLCEKKCYEKTSGTIPSTLETMTFGNILFGGFIGVGIDAASGAMNEYVPSLNINMTKKEGCNKKDA